MRGWQRLGASGSLPGEIAGSQGCRVKAGAASILPTALLAADAALSSAQNSNVENLPPHIIRLVYKEVKTLTADPPDGIKVFPNEEDLTDLQVTIEGPGESGEWGL